MVIFSIVAAFIIGALIVFLIFWYKRRKAEKRKEKENELANETDKEEDDLKLSSKSENGKGQNETTAMGLKGDGSHIMNRSRDRKVDDLKETNGQLNPKSDSINDYSEEEEKVERM